MPDALLQIFDEFERGVISPESFQHQLQTLCTTTPGRVWEALAMLDQHFRRGRIASELQQSLRHRIERQALGIESYQPQPAPAPSRAMAPSAVTPAIAVAPDAEAEDPATETALAREPKPGAVSWSSARWQRYRRNSPAIALLAVMLAVAASPTVEEDAGAADTAMPVPISSNAGAETWAAQVEAGPDMLSLSSDRYIVNQDSDVAELSVERSANAAGDTSFLWWTEGSGAKPDEDYAAAKPRRVPMTEGVGSSTLRIHILKNPKRRHIEMFYVLIGRPEGHTGIGPIHRAAVFLMPRPAR